MADLPVTRACMRRAIEVLSETLAEFTPGQRGVIINAASQILGVLEPSAKESLAGYPLYGADEDNG